MRSLFFLLSLLPFNLLIFSPAWGLSVAPDKPIVQIGQRLVLTANDAKGKVVWAVGDGSKTGIGKTITYIAPPRAGKDVVAVTDETGTVVAISIIVQSPQHKISLENALWKVYSYQDSVTTVLPSDDGRTLWIGTKGGLEERDALSGQVIKFYTKKDGLPENWIRDLASDGRGGLWIGTNSGLAHFANSKFRVFDKSNSDLPDQQIRSLLADGSGGVWIGMLKEGGLAHYTAKGEWLVFNPDNSGLGSITDLISDGSGGLWLPVAEGVAHFLSNGNRKIFKTTLGSAFRLTSDGHGGVWIGTWMSGIEHLTAEGQSTVYNQSNSGLANDRIRSLSADSSDGVWIGTEKGGLAYFSANGQWTVFNQSNSDLPDNNIQSLASDGAGGQWIGTDGGLVRITANGQHTVFRRSEMSLPSNTVTSLLTENNGALWVGTGDLWGNPGLAHLANGQWTQFNSDNSLLPEDDIQSLASDGKGGLWVGTFLQGLYHRAADGQWSRFSVWLPDDTINSLLNGSNGDFWIGTPLGLIHCTNDKKCTTYTHKDSGLPDSNIYSLASDGNGGLWIGTAGGLAHRAVDGNWNVFNSGNSGLPANLIHKLALDGNDGLWIGTSSGLAYRSEKGQWTVFNQSNSELLPDDNIASLLTESTGGVWIGTHGRGLVHRTADGQWIVFNTGNSTLPDNQVLSLASDNNGGVWVGTEQGGLAHLTFTSQIELCQQQQTTAAQCDALLNSQRAAILIAGGGKQDSNTLWDTTRSISNGLYQLLIKRAFNKTDIFYISSELDADFNGDGFNDHIVNAPDDEHVTSGTVQMALDWASQRGKLDQPLYLFFTDHGGTNKLQLSQTETLEVDKLKAMLDSYQTATGNEVVIVIDACYSGEFGRQLAGEHRAVITSTGNSLAYFNRLAKKGFSSFLGDGLTKGMSFAEAFSYAQNQQDKMLGNVNISVAVTSGTQNSAGILAQVPWYDDRNRINTLDNLFLNGAFVTGDTTLAVKNNTAAVKLGANQPVTLSAHATVAQGEVKAVWAVVRPPRIDLLTDSNNTPILAYPRVNLAPIGDGQWQGLWTDTLYNGDYSITLYAQDSEGDITSSDNKIITVVNGPTPPEHAGTQLRLNQTTFRPGDTITVQVSEEMSWGYDLYLALKLPSGDFYTFKDRFSQYQTDNLSPTNTPQPWRGFRQQGQPHTVIDYPLPKTLAKGDYCLHAILSPEREAVLNLNSQRYWRTAQQCFTIQ